MRLQVQNQIGGLEEFMLAMTIFAVIVLVFALGMLVSMGLNYLRDRIKEKLTKEMYGKKERKNGQHKTRGKF